MIRARLLTALAVLLPVPALAQNTPEALIAFVETHCIAPFPGLAIYDLPRDSWSVVPPRKAARQAPQIAIQEAIGYAAFAVAGGGKPLTDPDERWYGLTIQEYQDELSNQRDFASRDWLRLFSHDPSGARLFIGADIFPDDVADGSYDPLDWATTSCWLWHPDKDHALNDAITARWGLPFGNRLDTPLGTLTRHYARADVKGTQMELQTVVLEPNPGFDDALAKTILHLRVTDRW